MIASLWKVYHLFSSAGVIALGATRQRVCDDSYDDGQIVADSHI